MSENIKKIIAKTFEEIADGLSGGGFGSSPKIGLMEQGSEHGAENMQQAVKLAEKLGVSPVLVADDKDMEAALQSNEIEAAVAMHYNFPIGVATVGRVITPAQGRHLYIASTTGTADTNRAVSMVKNAIYGIIAAKACGIERPSIGILNIDSARQVEIALKELAAKGYDINFSESKRADGGCIMRGNDVLNNPCDIIVTDSLTGNVLVKMLSAYTTGGNYEASGFGYGPGIGENYDKLVLIVSRASGAAVVANAMSYAGELVRGGFAKIAKQELAAAKKAGLAAILEKLAQKSAPAEKEAVKAPPTEIATAEISGIEISELEDAVACLWKANIYAASGMGCTGPVVLVNEAKLAQAQEILVKAGYISID